MEATGKTRAPADLGGGRGKDATGEPAPTGTGRDYRASAIALATRWGVLIAFVGMVITFLALEPDTFTKTDTWRGILNQAAIPAILAMGLTVALIVGDFDLSIGAVIGLAMGVVVILMVDQQVGWLLASMIALAAGAAVGLLNGILVAGAGVNSFIGTLAVSSIVMGIDAKVTTQETVSTGIPTAFQDLGADRFVFDLTVLFWIAVAVGALLWLFTTQTESGRFMFAIGGNREAARLAGVRVRTLRVSGFLISGMAAALCGVLLAASSAGYYPNAGTGFLLPAFAAAFLGTAITRGKFSIVATAFAVFFLQTLETGLTVLNVETWIVLVVEGSVLAIAVILGNASSVPKIRRRRAMPASAAPAGTTAGDPPSPNQSNPHQEERRD